VLLVSRDLAFRDHDPGPGHPEHRARLDAVRAGLAAADVGDALVDLEPRLATRAELEAVHASALLDTLEAVDARGGGRLDPDTVMSAGSWAAARHAAGAGLAAVESLTSGVGTAAFLGVRPPGHHATPTRAMGFCVVNHVATTAAALRDGGARVAIVDIDAHHGNGTESIFWADPDVLFVSLHQWPFYPGTGALDDRGGGAGVGFTCNLPMPAGATGDVYRQAFDDVVAPVVERFAPDWILVSAGFDAHRADPLTDLGLSSADYGALMARLVAWAPRPGRLVAFLEGGYDRAALRDCTAATARALLGLPARPVEAPTAGGPGAEGVRRAYRTLVVPA
jgi:acetoin utilization deacetylase AcuC-like enzyme